MFVVGEPAAEVADTYAALAAAQELAVRAATVGTTCEDVDAVARRALAADGLADAFIHRIGHGIGLDAHEDPYLVAGNADAARARARVQHRAGRLLPRSVRDAARGHRGRRPVRPRPAQPGRAGPRRGRVSGRRRHVHLDAATILLQWATGGLAFLWVTTRGRLVSLGYGWLLRERVRRPRARRVRRRAPVRAHRGPATRCSSVAAAGVVAGRGRGAGRERRAPRRRRRRGARRGRRPRRDGSRR